MRTMAIRAAWVAGGRDGGRRFAQSRTLSTFIKGVKVPFVCATRGNHTRHSAREAPLPRARTMFTRETRSHQSILRCSAEGNSEEDDPEKGKTMRGDGVF